MIEEIKKFFKGDLENSEEVLKKYSRDASLFEIKPILVAYPKDVEDIKNLVKFATREKERGRDVSITPRAGGTDMSGGAIGESIILDFGRYFNHIKEVSSDGYAVVEPGVYYRDFEKETLKKGYIFPSYPASREICMMGGMVANNAGGEKTLKYGKTEDYIESLKVVLDDGNEYEIKALNENELEEKQKLETKEGKIYQTIHEIIGNNYKEIKAAKPNVSKNSAGYYLWNVWDKEKNIFDLNKLIVGSQGTLGIITEMKLRLVKTKPYSGLVVVFMKDLSILADLVNKVLKIAPVNFESFDDYTFKLALKFLPSFVKLMGAKNFLSLFFDFIPELWLITTYGMPKLTLLIEFEGDSNDEVNRKIKELNLELKNMPLKIKVIRAEKEMQEYWTIRRESFNLLRHKIKDKQTAPFVDDLIVRPEFLPEFLPQLYKILDKYKLLYTIAGHMGDGNFHIIPLMELAKEAERSKISKVADEVYDLTLRYKGSITAEHNDGLVRSYYLPKMFGPKIYGLFEEVKKIFDPQNIFNPGKKVNTNREYALSHIKRS